MKMNAIKTKNETNIRKQAEKEAKLRQEVSLKR